MKHPFALTTIAAFALAALPCLAAIAQIYNVQDLGTLGGSYSYAFALNEFGHVVGYSATTGDASNHAFRWQPGKFQILPGTGIQVYIPPALNDLTPGYAANSSATGINNGDMVAVNIDGSTSEVESSYIWTAGYSVAYVPIEIDGQSSQNCSAQSINDSGDLAGSALDPFGHSDAYVWADSVTSVLAVSGNSNSINAYSHVAGTYRSLGYDYAFLSTSSLQTLGTPANTDTIAVALNDNDLVVGNWYVGNHTYAVLWSGAGMTSLGTLGGSSSLAYGINNQGEVVGMSTTSNSWDAFLVTNGVMRDLNSLIPAGTGWILAQATAINDMEQITGWGVHNGATRAFLLTPRYAINATSRVSIARGAITFHGFGHPYTQTVTLTNTSTRPIVGPVSLVLDSLKNAVLDNATGTTANVSPLGSPYININIGTQNTLGPGAQASVTLQLGHSFFAPPISYTPRLLIGSGSR